MEPGECSGARDDNGDAVWAKLVPCSSEFSVMEITSHESVICSETACSSFEKSKWCKITWTSDENVAKVQNVGSRSIIVDGRILYEGETSNIRSGSEIISGPSIEGYLGYKFEVFSAQEHDKSSLKISLDVDHAKCSICLNVWHDVVTVAPCLHNFCNGCFSEWMRRCSKRSLYNHKIIDCPQCRARVHSVGRNHFLRQIEVAILQNFTSLNRSNDEILMLDAYASIKSNVILDSGKAKPRKRSSSLLNDDGGGQQLSCPQCGDELGGFRCSQSTNHLQCQGCGRLMPSRPDAGFAQVCMGCDRAFCGAYWRAQGVDATDFNIICSPETFKPISERTISRIPYSVHQNNQFERNITESCIQQTGKSLEAVILEWVTKFNNREIDRSRLPLNHAETITSRTHLCNECFDKLVDFLLYWFRISIPRSLLPPDAIGRDDCWYGYSCRTQHHNAEHAQKRNHVCRPTRGNPAL